MPIYTPPSYAATIAPRRRTQRELVVAHLASGARYLPWGRGIEAALAFSDRDGHLVVPRFHIESGYGLGEFIHCFRGRFYRREIDDEQIRILNALGMVWRVGNTRWAEVYIPAFTAFARREGHLRVPRRHRENGIKLGHLTHNTRNDRKHGRVPQWRIDVLDSLGFEWRVCAPRPRTTHKPDRSR
ncbi:helicase associated domain-containing protein [Micromonospora sp. WMMD1082]|uniref:helicase associated domain-containing protein n=1 Tax=Micromonospora sp. WMMD1082 TaxID=3016104 RepID=UPI002416BCC1|nr:helicase associated domain-containing protein [Micromonospora sp. WMMD1082]MDG4795519.1 helicase associated domain-containing protein [Micromonospora sp. WMMD1082]